MLLLCAQLVEIDHASGAIDRVLAVHDVGKAVNPTLVEGQIEGSVHMGLGYALTEDFPATKQECPLSKHFGNWESFAQKTSQRSM